MDLEYILQKFGNFDAKSDCLVMIRSDESFSFYAPDQYAREQSSASEIPDHVMIGIIFAYLAAHVDEHREALQALTDKAFKWMTQAVGTANSA